MSKPTLYPVQGINLQICFMKKSLSDTDRPTSDSEVPAISHLLDTVPLARRHLSRSTTTNIEDILESCHIYCICFMNESLSDTDSPTSDSEVPAISPHRLDTVTPTPSPSVPLDDIKYKGYS
ncbi:unnamed protein product [Phaedon cochleariae]|uniref:Schwannomin interacting protein 1 C-terminal domain-containing protein n=1 Tax=Phaedon cochleariae TaxID=80249 RepID=A0A9N9SCJ5_PHACE|nr:unnamed protein product [Phaedon cochleariae]